MLKPLAAWLVGLLMGARGTHCNVPRVPVPMASGIASLTLECTVARVAVTKLGLG